MKNLLLIIILSFLKSAVLCQQTESENKLVDYFPNERLFPLISLDPLTCQSYGGIHFLYEKGDKKKGVFIPINLGFSKPFFGFDFKSFDLEIGLDVASYYQFEIIHIERNIFLGGLFNNDYKVGAYISTEYKNMLYRISLFHISSHLGDDYIIRNEISSRNDQSVNYEQLDITIMKKIRHVEYYLGPGYVFSPYAYRKRFSFLAGFQFDVDNQKPFHLIGGLNIKSFHQNNYYPNIRSAIGTAYYPGQKPAFRLQLEFYHGHLPYSTLEYRKITWLGISSTVNIGF